MFYIWHKLREIKTITHISKLICIVHMNVCVHMHKMYLYFLKVQHIFL